MKSFELFLKQIKPALSEKVKGFFVKVGFLDNSGDTLVLTIQNIITALFGLAISAGIRVLILAVFSEIIALGSFAIIPGIGWAVSIILGIGNLVISFSNYLGMWKTEKCFEDVIQILYKNLIGNKEELIKLYKNNFNETFGALIQILERSKEESDLNEELNKIINKYKKTEDDNNLKKNDVFKISYLNRIETLKIENQTELTKVKNYLKDSI